MTIDTLPAGRELDRLVAEKVFGYRWYALPEYRHREFVGYRRYLMHPIDQQAIIPTAHRPLQDDDLPPEEPWDVLPYSTSIEAAWQVVEKLRAHKECRCVEISGGDHWHCLFRGFGFRANGSADTMELAICRAALKWVENREK